MTSPSPTPRVLVVEDNDLTRTFVVDLITSFGFGVASVADAMEAMRMIGDIPTIELVFTDIAMPGVDGIVLADMVKQHRPNLKILYTTGGYGITRLKTEAGILHGNVLTKPYRPEQLRAEIIRLLGDQPSA
jgi:CheY-like chemotaxis protein